MREWDGIHDDVSPVGEGPFILSQNVTLRTQGHIERRAGLTSRIATARTVLRMAAHETTGVGSWLMMGTSTGVDAVNLTTGTLFNCLTGLTNSTYRPTFSYINQFTFVSNGVDSMKYIVRGDQVGASAGISAPSTPSNIVAAGGGMTAGVHLIRTRSYDLTQLTYSDPSAAISATTTTVYATCTVASTTTLICEITLSNGTEFFRVPVGTTLNVADQIIATWTAVNTYAGPDGYGYEIAPVCRLSTVHRGRLFLWGPTSGSVKDLIYWSRFGFPAAFRANVWARSGTLANGDVPSAIMSFQDDLYLIGNRSMTRLIYTSDPADGILSPVPTNLGAFNQACCIAVDTAIYGFGRNGAWKITGIMPKYLSNPIEDTILSDIDYANVADCFVSYCGLQRVVRFHYSSTDATYGRGKKCAAYHIDEDKWTIDTFGNEISQAVQASTPTGNTYLYAAEGITYAGDLFRFQLNMVSDCCDSASTNGAFTAQSGSTTTVVNISPTATASGFIGAYLYRPATGERKRVSANTTSTITVSTAFGSAITTGEDFYAGPIDVRLKPFWSTLAGTKISRARASYCIMEHIGPTTSTPEFRVQFYLDWSATATNFTKNTNDTQPDGVSLPSSTTSYALVTPVNGVSAIPMPSEWNRVVRWDVQQIKPFGTIKLMDMRWSIDKNGTPVERSQA